jgi:hypothetical protein
MYIPCLHIGGKTLAKHSLRWVMTYPYFPLKLKANKCQAFHKIYANDNYTFSLVTTHRMIDPLEDTKHENSKSIKRKWI